MKRFLSLMLTMLPLIAGCTGGNSPIETDSTAQSAPTTEPNGDTNASTTASDTPSTTDPVTEPGETESLPPPDVEVVRDGTCVVTIVYPESNLTIIENTMLILSTALTQKLGTNFGEVTGDTVKEEVIKGEYDSDAPELLIGETNRRESRDVHLTLEQGQYAIRTVGNKVVIIGYNDDLTREAVKAFITDYIEPSDGKSLALPGDLSVVRAPYSVEAARTSVDFEAVTPVGELITATTEQWVMCELELTSSATYEDPVYTVETDVIFRHKESGETLCIPAFWDGGTTWRVRFAPTQVGEWEFYTTCSDTENTGLHHRAGTVTCQAYTGDLAIYKHGFVRSEPGKNYFTYADGTPFFYLGDTYWNLPLLELDSYGSVASQAHAGITEQEAAANGITSQFTYVMDYRAEQGYTVIQSEPLSKWTAAGGQTWFADTKGDIFVQGVNEAILEKFQQYDRYFAYIAEKGFVHAHTQFGWPTNLMDACFGGQITDEQLEKLCRYWVARYGAYPVMWTTTQEGDNDYYGERGDSTATPETNPWRLVFSYVQAYDVYDHPATCHQEHWDYTTVENSAFNTLDGYSWYAAQYHTSSKEEPDWHRLRAYWNNPGSMPVINYEGRYDHLWTGSYGSRAQGWIAFLNGQAGYGYGVQPLWGIWASGTMGTDWVGQDEWGEFEQDGTWLEGLRAEAGEQVTYIKQFLSEIEWWKLAPCFEDSYYYVPGRYLYAVSHISNQVYVCYFYGNQNRGSLGELTGMENGTYEVTWFNCQTGEWGECTTVTVTDGTYKISKKPDTGDWALLVQAVHE